MRLHQLGYRQIGARTEGCNLIQRRREKKKTASGYGKRNRKFNYILYIKLSNTLLTYVVSKIVHSRREKLKMVLPWYERQNLCG